MIIGMKTEVEWLKSLYAIPILGGWIPFLLAFILPVITSAILEKSIIGFEENYVFESSMMVLIPLWNLFLWLINVRVYILWLPSWLIMGVIVLIKLIERITEASIL